MAQDIKQIVSANSDHNDPGDIVVADKNRLDVEHMSQSERLSLPCEEPIDLRDLFPSQCFPYRRDGITHFLDSRTEEFFVKQLKLNDDYYTQAVYEAVLKYSTGRLTPKIYPEEIAHEEEEAFKPPAVIPVGYSQHRQENRLNYATDIEIELPSGSIIHGRSIDISSSGIQIKLEHILDVIIGMEMDVSFPGLEAQYERSFGAVPYKLMKSSIGSMHMVLMLARTAPGEHPFDEFLHEFIVNKKHRYRIDAEDSKLALTAKAWEYLYTKALPYLACFVSTNDDRLQIQEIAVSVNNKQQISGLGNSMLSLLEQQMSSFRLNAIAHRETTPPEIYAYRYKGDGIRRRLCATSWQFKDNKSKLTFLRTGINEDTFTAWRINVVRLKEMSAQRSTELLEKLAETNVQQAENLMEQLNHYEYLFYLIDITDSLRLDPLFINELDDQSAVPEDSFFDDYEVQRGRSAEYTRLRLGIGKQRNENRYIYQSPLLLKFYGESFKGHTLDLSVNGMKIVLDNPQSFQIRDTVTVDFVGLNKKFRSSKLKNQSYRIAAITRDGGLCLQRDHRIADHDAAIFINKLLTKNQETLPACTGELWMNTKSRLIESWMNLCLPSQSLLMTREKNHYDIPYILSGNYTSQLLAPFQIGREIYNLDKLLASPKLKAKIRQLKINIGKPANLELYISQHQASEEDIPVIELKAWSDFDNEIDRVEYLKECCRHPIFGFYNLAITKVPRLDTIDLIDDMNVIRRNARHRLADFENEYKSLTAILELTDCTDLIMLRYNLSWV